MNFTCIFFGLVFIISGFLFAIGKLHDHLPAWKDTPDEEKEKINITALCRNIGFVIMLCGVIFSLKGFTAILSGNRFIIAMIAWLVAAGFDVWRISKSKRYRKQKANATEKK